MIGLLQRVTQAKVEVSGELIGEVSKGLLILLGVERDDTEKQADRLLERLLGYRVFEDDTGRMNLSLRDIQGGMLIVPQFTLPADTNKGTRPSFTPAASPEEGERLYDYFVSKAKAAHDNIATGEFGADMQVNLVNDGPVTFWLQTN